MATKKLGSDLPEEDVERLQQWCARKGMTQYRTLIAALEAFYILSPNARELFTERRYAEIRDQIAAMKAEAWFDLQELERLSEARKKVGGDEVQIRHKAGAEAHRRSRRQTRRPAG